MTDYDRVAREIGLPADWRERGFDTADTMDTHYRPDPEKAMRCVWTPCGFRSNDLERMFRHAHGSCAVRKAWYRDRDLGVSIGFQKHGTP